MQPRLDASEPIECQPTLERLQQVLDGDEAASVLANDEHARTCSTCRERVRAAWVMAGVLSRSSGDFPPQPGLTHSILVASMGTRRQFRLQVWASRAAGMAIAAGLIAAIVLLKPPFDRPEIVKAPPPVRLSDAFADAGSALQRIGKQITVPAMEMPPVFPSITGALTQPATPLAADFEPATRTLAELPGTALGSLEPITGTATRAFSRLFQDVSTVQVTKPKS